MIELKIPVVIAIDGHSSCGKSSFAKSIAQELNYLYIDSGAMYRAVTLYAMRGGFLVLGRANSSELETHLSHIDINFVKNNTVYETYLNGENVENAIRTMEVSENVSEISKINQLGPDLLRFNKKWVNERKL